MCLYVCSLNVFSTARNRNRVLVGQEDSLLSVLLYTHVLYEGEDVRVYRILLFCSITLLAKEFSITMIIQFFLKFAARKAAGCCTLFQIYWGKH